MQQVNTEKVPLMAKVSASEAADLKNRTLVMLQNVKEVQQRVLQNLLEKNCSCEYLRRYRIDGNSDVQTFKEKMPLIEYADVKEDVERISRAEANILTSDEIVYFRSSSGTSGESPKLIPVTKLGLERTDLFYRTQEAWFQDTQVFQDLPSGGLGMTILSYGTHFTTPSGHDVAALSTFFAKSPTSVYRQSPNHFVSPLDVILCQDYRQSLYCQLLCGLLKSPEVVMMSSILITMLETAVALLSDCWEELCNDIQTGKLSGRVTDTSARKAVSEILRAPNPELANRIRKECEQKSWAGILIRLWPSLKYISAVATGALLQFVEHFEFLTYGKVRILSSAGYGSSEGTLALNVHPEAHPNDVTYVFHPEMGFFEFWRLRDSSVIELSDVTPGEDEYEVIFTNLSGFWRSRMGDVVKCVGYYHSSPEFKFLGRATVLPSIAGELIYEYKISRAVESASHHHMHRYPDSRLESYTTTVNLQESPGHYVIFVEFEVQLQHREAKNHEMTENDRRESLRQCCLDIENDLTDKYWENRRAGTVGPLELILLKPGIFSQLHKESMAARASNQLKQPRTYNPEHSAVELLYSAAQHRFRSEV